MKLAFAFALAVVVGAVPTSAGAARPKLTLESIERVTWVKAEAEQTKWPAGTRITVRGCKVSADQRRAHCFYDLDHYGDDNTQRACNRRVNSLVFNKPRRGKLGRTWVKRLGCHSNELGE